MAKAAIKVGRAIEITSDMNNFVSRRSVIFTCGVLLTLAACHESVHTYRLSDPIDPLGEKLLQIELKKQNVAFEVSKDGYYSVSAGQFEKLVAIGREVNEKSLRRHSLTIDGGCSSAKFVEWLRSKDVVYVEGTSEAGPVVTFVQSESDLDVVDRYFKFHLACVRAGAEAEYTSIWKKPVMVPSEVKAK